MQLALTNKTGREQTQLISPLVNAIANHQFDQQKVMMIWLTGPFKTSTPDQ
jgi:hypothetical protein